MSDNFAASTLEYYNYGDTSVFKPVTERYKVKVSDKDGNIITIEKDDSLYACVGLTLDANEGILRLIDKAHDDSVLAEIEMPGADYVYNCRYDEEIDAILFDVKSLYGDETSTIELNVSSLVDIYEAGQGIEIGEKKPDTGKKPISIKLAEGENILRLSDSGLSISDSVATDEELEAAVSGKADIEYVDIVHEHLSNRIDGVDEKLDEEIRRSVNKDIEHDEKIDYLESLVVKDELGNIVFDGGIFG